MWDSALRHLHISHLHLEALVLRYCYCELISVKVWKKDCWQHKVYDFNCCIVPSIAPLAVIFKMIHCIWWYLNAMLCVVCCEVWCCMCVWCDLRSGMEQPFCRPPTRSGGRNMQDTTLSISVEGKSMFDPVFVLVFFACGLWVATVVSATGPWWLWWCDEDWCISCPY